ncbi:hypothetical protein V2W45_1436856 [Cenococcum geophilum]
MLMAFFIVFSACLSIATTNLTSWRILRSWAKASSDKYSISTSYCVLLVLLYPIYSDRINLSRRRADNNVFYHISR